MNDYLVVHTDPHLHPLTSDHIEELKDVGARVTYFDSGDGQDFLEIAGEADAVLNADFPLPALLINRLRRCRIIARYGMGVDNIDVSAATARGIMVANVPEFGTEEVADRAILLLLAAACALPVADRDVRQGRWRTSAWRMSAEVGGQTLGLVGFGRIARAIARRAAAFDLRVVACDPYLDAKVFEAHGVTRLELEGLLATSDYVCLVVPLTNETRHLLDARRLALMKASAIVINVARGGILDQQALAEALRAGRLAGAGLDVPEREPPDPADPLLGLDNVVLTPHTATFTRRAMDSIRQQAVASVIRVLRGERIPNLVNPEVLTDGRTERQ
ncbi:MAG: C-terminal binding protein [Chloroflexi bacterium]|nr:C-terminal binding protein [Chloroflexota bacterium]